MCKLLASILLLSSLANAVDTPIAGGYRSFDGGLNNCDSSIAIAANESPNLQNVIIDEPLNTLSQRSGYLTCGSVPSGNTATNLFEYVKNNGSRNLIVTDNVTIWQTPDCVQFSTITTGLSAQDLPRFAIVNDALWIVNGSTWPIVWNGTTASQLDGQGGRPTGPRGKYITFWKSRVWIGNTTTQTNGLYFSSLVDTSNAILDPATSTMAWANSLNLVLFGGGGGALYGIKVYRDNLYAFLENNIFRMLFESEYTVNGITVNKAVANIGSKFQESIVEMDDSLLRFVGRDGVYLFDGSTVKRISKKWTPTFFSLKQPSHAEQSKIWDTDIDWNAGTTVNTSTSNTVGSVTLKKSSGTFINGGFQNAYPPAQCSTQLSVNDWVASTGTWLSGYCNGAPLGATLTGPRDSSPVPLFAKSSCYPTSDCVLAFPNVVSIKVYDSSGLVIATQAVSNPTTVAIHSLDLSTFTQTQISVEFSANTYAVLKSKLFSKPEIFYYIAVTTITDTSNNSCGTVATGASCSGSSSKRTLIVDMVEGDVFTASGTYTSQVSTATSLTLWKTFDTDQLNNGQTISYLIRTAATAAAVPSATWRTVTPGTIVSSTTNNYAQWMSTFSTTISSITPVLNLASIGWVTGDTSLSPITGINYKSRYWLSASTTPGNSYNDIVMVENRTSGVGFNSYGMQTSGLSNGGSFTMFNLPISAFTLWNNNLYGSISNTGKIARLDYGNTDDGGTITSFWDSRDEVYENPVMYKSINQLIFDYASTPANNAIKIGLSQDFGNNWQYQTVNTAKNPAIPRNTSIVNVNANRALQFRSRIFNSNPGVGFLIYGLYNFGTMSDFHGN